jgi:hypothetical protein
VKNVHKLAAVAAACLLVSACSSAPKEGQTEEQARASLNRVAAFEAPTLDAVSSYSGLQKKRDLVTTLTIKAGYSVTDPAALVRSLFENAWSVNDTKPTSISMTIAGTTTDFSEAASAVGADATPSQGDTIIIEPISAAEKHFGSWPGKVPASIAGVSKQ